MLLTMDIRSLLGLALVCVSGCTLGEVGDDVVVGGDDDLTPAAALCESTLTMSGTFTPPGTPPTADLGCVPEGTWAVTVTVADLGDCADAPVGSTYTYTVVGQGSDQMINYTGATGEELNSGIHAGGNGECEGTFEHIWAADASGEFHVAQLKPYFEPGTLTIQGGGTYQLWSRHP